MSLEPSHASPLVTCGMVAIAVALAGVVAAGVLAAGRRPGEPAGAGARRAALFAAAAAAWMGAFHIAAASGLLARAELRPPPALGVFAAVLLGGIALARSPAGRACADHLPLAALVGVHAFRLPLELVMHEAAREGVMPPQMTFTGCNLDILTGVTAIPVALLAARGRAPRGLLVAWNALGLTLLGVVVTVALLSTPLVRAFGDAPARLNTWVLFPPFVWLPAVMVVVAWAGHLALLRRLAREPR